VNVEIDGREVLIVVERPAERDSHGSIRQCCNHPAMDSPHRIIQPIVDFQFNNRSPNLLVIFGGRENMETNQLRNWGFGKSVRHVFIVSGKFERYEMEPIILDGCCELSNRVS
jgi:hypothetical protein